MRILIKILLLPVKLIALILMLLLRIIYGLGQIIIRLGSWVVGPLMTFVFICALWSAFQANWYHVGLLAAIEVLIFALFIGADALLVGLLAMSDGLKRLLHA